MKNTESVHLQLFPDVSFIDDEKDLIEDMDIVRDICSTALAIRDKKNLRVRMPLNALKIVIDDSSRIEQYIDIIKDEVNVKNIIFDNDINSQASFKLKINFKSVGLKLGENMKEVIKLSNQGKWEKLDNGDIKLGDFILNKDDIEVKLVANNDDILVLPKNNILVWLDTEITEELEQEGIARDLIRSIQQNRKESGLNVSDRINISINADDRVIEAMNKHINYIKEQTLSESIEINKSANYSFKNKIEEFIVEMSINLHI